MRQGKKRGGKLWDLQGKRAGLTGRSSGVGGRSSGVGKGGAGQEGRHTRPREHGWINSYQPIFKGNQSPKAISTGE